MGSARFRDVLVALATHEVEFVLVGSSGAAAGIEAKTAGSVCARNRRGVAALLELELGGQVWRTSHGDEAVS
ncbi:MAG: hypothetical protein HY744_26810 [Deltaproteobacteria bacterium]|nr:hypothetical protein [Deltaproteobacteria bacterium]